MEIREVIQCRGHANVTGRHPTTFMITTEEEMTLNGDCIIGISADKSLHDLSDAFSDLLSDDRTILRTILVAEGIACEIWSEGSAQMALDHPTDLVWRRSDYVCGRTIGIRSNYVARTLPKGLIEALSSGALMEVTLIAERMD